eukprot:COSAG04_NODE_2958_length_3346_cov_4.979366_3_plen_153_part_00
MAGRAQPPPRPHDAPLHRHLWFWRPSVRLPADVACVEERAGDVSHEAGGGASCGEDSRALPCAKYSLFFLGWLWCSLGCAPLRLFGFVSFRSSLRSSLDNSFLISHGWSGEIAEHFTILPLSLVIGRFNLHAVAVAWVLKHLRHRPAVLMVR